MNLLMAPLTLHLDQGSLRDGVFYEYPGLLGLTKVVGWDVPDELVDKYIPLEFLEGAEYNHIPNYIGKVKYSNKWYHLFHGYHHLLNNLPEKFKNWVLYEDNLEGGLYPYQIDDLMKLIIRSGAEALEELRERGVSHGSVKERNIVFILNHAHRISSVKLMGFTYNQHKSKWKQDFYDFGIVIKSLLGPYDNFPEALDFVARFDGSHRNTKLMQAFKKDPRSVERHLICWIAEKGLSFLIRLADWMDGYRSKSLDKVNYKMSYSDHMLYDAIQQIDTVDWKRGLPAYIMKTLPYTEFNSSEEFLKFGRNHHLHSASDPGAFQKFFKVTPEGYYKVFKAQNPEFMMDCYNAVEEFFEGDSGVVEPEWFDHFLISPSHLW